MRSVRVWSLAAVAAVLLGGGLIVAGMNDEVPALTSAPASAVVPASAAPAASPSVTAAGSPSVTAAVSPATAAPAGPGAAADRATRVKRLNAALKAVDGDFSVAVLDRKTGQAYAYRGSVAFDTASIVKTQILACLLLTAQDAGRRLTAGEMALARPMIRLSDNDATTTLYRQLGGRTAVTRTNKRLGLTRTVVNSRWGLTRTTATDQVALLAALVDPQGPLNAASRKTAFTLMNTVDPAQDWGVPALARTGEISTVKNGWDTRTADGGRWAVNTIGRITSRNGTVDVSVAVLSHDNPTMRGGVTLVERVAGLTRRHLRY